MHLVKTQDTDVMAAVVTQGCNESTHTKYYCYSIARNVGFTQNSGADAMHITLKFIKMPMVGWLSFVMKLVTKFAFGHATILSAVMTDQEFTSTHSKVILLFGKTSCNTC